MGMLPDCAIWPSSELVLFICDSSEILKILVSRLVETFVEIYLWFPVE